MPKERSRSRQIGRTAKFSFFDNNSIKPTKFSDEWGIRKSFNRKRLTDTGEGFPQIP